MSTAATLETPAATRTVRARKKPVFVLGEWVAQGRMPYTLHYVSAGKTLCGVKLGNRPQCGFGLHMCARCKGIFDTRTTDLLGAVAEQPASTDIV